VAEGEEEVLDVASSGMVRDGMARCSRWILGYKYIVLVSSLDS